MVSIGLFEPSWHPELIAPLTQISLKNAEEVTVITTNENWEVAKNTPRFDPEKVTKVTNRKSETLQHFFHRVETISEELDILWLVTPFGDVETRKALFNFSPRCNSISFVHEAGRYLKSNHKKEIFVNKILEKLHIFPKNIENTLWNHLAPRIAHSSWIANYDCLVSLYPTIASYMRSRIEKPVRWLLPEFYRHNPNSKSSERLMITIPGAVSELRRDYSFAFDVLEALPPSEICLDLLGTLKQEDIKNRVSELRAEGYKIKLTNSWIEPSAFEVRLNEADVIFTPVKMESRSGKELIGKTKTTGSIGDAVRSGTPIFLPSDFPEASEFEGLIQHYNNKKDIVEDIERMMIDDEYLNTAAQATAQKFNIRKQSERMEDIHRLFI
jgi:hypothetical protein